MIYDRIYTDVAKNAWADFLYSKPFFTFETGKVPGDLGRTDGHLLGGRRVEVVEPLPSRNGNRRTGVLPQVPRGRQAGAPGGTRRCQSVRRW